MKTLKAEEINGKAFVDLDDARRRINSFIAEIYLRGAVQPCHRNSTLRRSQLLVIRTSNTPLASNVKLHGPPRQGWPILL